jgi:L-ascorbate metabolism protein UlaG (beta-lactamase superfamily)
MERKDLLQGLRWFGHASFLWEVGGLCIYLDPWQLPKGVPKGDLVLITHDHYDHFSPDDVATVVREGTRVVTVKDCAQKLAFPSRVIGPGEEVQLGKVTVRAIRAYNMGKPYHPKSKNWVGFVVLVEGRSLYHAGDTDHIPEMRAVEADVGLLPVGGTYTMNAEEAAAATKDMKLKVAVPMHWGRIVGSEADARRFAEKAAVEVVILRAEG